MKDRLRVVVASHLGEEQCDFIEKIEPRVEMVRDLSLIRPPRFPGDHTGDPGFVRSSAEEARFRALLDSAEALYGVPDGSPEALHRTVRANADLIWVHTPRSGGGEQVKAAQLDECSLRKVAFTTSAGVHAEPLAEFAILGVLAGAKNLDRLQAHQRRHEWVLPWAMGGVSGQRAVVVGLGNIGRAVVTKLAALGADVTGVHRRPVTVPGATRVVSVADLPSVLPHADSVILALPATDSTHKLFDRALFSVVKPGATFVNVGRGSTVDEEALVDALADGRIGFAALDVFAVEPLPADSPLWDMPGVIVSPHGASATTDEDRRIAELFAENASRLLNGEQMLNVIDVDEFY
jgi:phosphoglycerate dehydrogenase-like enzyme